MARWPVPLDSVYEAIAAGSLEWVDLSHELSEATPIIELPPPYANTPGWSLEQVSDYDERGPWFYWNSFRGSEHMGTHFDAPVHWITGRDGDDVSRIPPERLIGPAAVLDRTAEVAADPDYLLTLDDVRRFEAEHGPLPSGGWLLYRTGWSTRYWDRNAFLKSDEHGAHWPGVDPECARFLAEETEIRGLGVEQIGIDAGRAHELAPAHARATGVVGVAGVATRPAVLRVLGDVGALAVADDLTDLALIAGIFGVGIAVSISAIAVPVSRVAVSIS